MALDRNHAYSSLEAIPQQFMPHTSQQDKCLNEDTGKQVVPDDGKQAAPDDGKQCAVNSDDTEKITNAILDTHENNCHHFPNHQPWRIKRLLLFGTVLLIIILAAVLGGVFGTRHGTRNMNSSTGPESPSNLSTTSPPTAPSQRSIAALSFTLNSHNKTRVYFLDNSGQVMEAGTAEPNTTWRIRALGVNGKSGSSIAAAVSRPGFPLVIHVPSTAVVSC